MKQPESTCFTLLILLACGCPLLWPTDTCAQPLAAGQSTKQAAHLTDTSYGVTQRHADSLSLDECIAAALKNNPDVRAAADELHAAHARYKQARAKLLPSVRIESGYERYGNNRRVLQPRETGEAGVFSDQLGRADAVLAMPLFSGGRAFNGMRAASHAHKAQEYHAQRQRNELTFAVSRLFYTICNLEKRTLSIQQSIEAMESHQQRVRAMIEAKKAAQVDLLRTNVRLADVRQQMLVVRNQLATHRTQLAAAMVVDIGARPLATHVPADTPDARSIPDSLYEHALGARADYLAADELLEAQARRVDIARGAFAPSISAQAGYGIRTDMAGEYEPGGSAGLSLSVPLFEGGRNGAGLQEKRAMLDAQQNRMHALRLRIATEIETVVLNINAARERIEIARMGIEAAKEGLRIEKIKYEQGKGTISEVLDAQAELLEAQTNYDEAYGALLIACAQLQLATGGFTK